MGSMTQEEISTSLFDECKRLKDHIAELEAERDENIPNLLDRIEELEGMFDVSRESHLAANAKLKRVESCRKYDFIATTVDKDYKYILASDIQEAIK